MYMLQKQDVLYVQIRTSSRLLHFELIGDVIFVLPRNRNVSDSAVSDNSHSSVRTLTLYDSPVQPIRSSHS